MVRTNRRIEQLALFVESHGADGASVADDDHSAQWFGKLELVHVADVRHCQQGNRTLPWGLQVFTTEAGSYPELLMAASSVVVFPVVILFLFARKYIVRGVARGGLKG